MAENRRPTRYLKFFVYLVVVVLVNIAGTTLFTRLDLTRERIYSLSEISKAAHPMGKSRTCDSCHGDRQVCRSEWTFIEDQGSLEPFSGGYDIIGDETRLAVTNLRADSSIEPIEGYDLTDFASWIYLKDRWSAPGNFSVPTPKDKYTDALDRFRALENRLEKLDVLVDGWSPKRQKQYRIARAAALHGYQDPERIEALDGFLSQQQ